MMGFMITFLKRYVLYMILSLSLLSGTLVASASAAQPHYVTVEDIKKSLEGVAPMAVGFDVDETILFASPVFYHLVVTLCDGQPVGCHTQPGFWEQANKLDTFSLPKPIGVELVKMHLARGDTVYFITARTYTADEELSQILRQLFKAPGLAPVVFVGYSPKANLKTPAIKERHIQIYYGDSDADIRAAQDPINNIRGIRMLRAKNTLEHVFGTPTPGLYDEEVVLESDR